MVDIIIFGVAGNRQNIERILDDNVSICGYTDIGPHFEDVSINEFESKTFVPIQALHRYKFDYIIVCSESEKNYLICEKILKEYGVALDKIVPTWPLTFKESMFQNTYLEYLERDKKFEVAVFGASTSRYGFISDMLGIDCFKFSLNGMDLHGIELFVSHLLDKSPYFSATKTIIFDFAYFAFNFDNCSTKQGQNLLRRMAIYDPFGDWGHYLSNVEADIRFKQYRAIKKLFSHKYEKIMLSKSNNYMSSDVFDEDKIDVFAHGAWTQIYADTIRENEMRFDRIMQMLMPIGADVFVVVYPLNAKFIKNNGFIIEKHKKMFYKRMEQFKKKYNIFVLDFNELDDFPSNYFYDVTHMNYCGALKMTQLIREKIFNKPSEYNKYDLNYSVKLLNWGWTKKERNGNICGISGDYNGICGLIINNNEKLHLTYQIHSVRNGWSELTDQGNAVEFEKEPINALRIYKTKGIKPISLRYKTYILGCGWSQWSEEGQESGDKENYVIIVALLIELFNENL